MASKPTTPTHAFETLTAKQASALLEKNNVNRSVRDTVVDKYARDMSSGDWDLCMAPIVIDVDGNILDGQHRLLAQVKTGEKIKWLVIRNAPKDAQKNIDTGAVRSIADHLHFAGEINSGLLAAVTRNVHKIKHGQMAGGTPLSASEILRTLEEHPEIRHSTAKAMQTRGVSLTPIAPSVLGAAHWMIGQVNGEPDADIFIWRISEMTNEPDGSPVLALMRRCNEIKRMRQHVKHRDFLAMTIKAWNLDAQGKKLRKISTYSKTGQYVLPEVIKREVPLAEIYDAEAAEDAFDPDEEEAEAESA